MHASIQVHIPHDSAGVGLSSSIIPSLAHLSLKLQSVRCQTWAPSAMMCFFLFVSVDFGLYTLSPLFLVLFCYLLYQLGKIHPATSLIDFSTINWHADHRGHFEMLLLFHRHYGILLLSTMGVWYRSAQKIPARVKQGCREGFSQNVQADTWVFPKIGVPPNHPF